MHDLLPLTALGSAAPRTDRIGAVAVTERPDRALASLAARRGREADLAARVARHLGLDLPGPGGAAGDGIAALWTGPGQWLLEAALPRDLATDVKAAVGDAGSVTDQTDGFAAFDVAGPDLPALFERLCNADLRRLVPGQAIRSTIERLGVFLLPRDGGMRLWTARSSAGSLHHALLTAARSIA